MHVIYEDTLKGYPKSRAQVCAPGRSLTSHTLCVPDCITGRFRSFILIGLFYNWANLLLEVPSYYSRGELRCNLY